VALHKENGPAGARKLFKIKAENLIPLASALALLVTPVEENSIVQVLFFLHFLLLLIFRQVVGRTLTRRRVGRGVAGFFFFLFSFFFSSNMSGAPIDQKCIHEMLKFYWK
jgi:hypothetical protein